MRVIRFFLRLRASLLLVLVSVVALAGLVLGVISLVGTVDFVLHAVPAVGRVVTNQPSVDSQGNIILYCPVVTYRTRTGRAITADDASLCTGNAPPIGSPLAIRYRTDQPTSIKSASLSAIWVGPLVLIGVGGFFSTFCLFFLWRWWIRPRRSRGAGFRIGKTLTGPLRSSGEG